MAWGNIIDVITGGLIKAIDFNQLMENIRVLGGNGTSAPSSDIESLNTLVVAMVAPTSGAGAPSSTPTVLGQIYIDSTADRMYVATGTGSSADWDIVAVLDSDVETITGGSGDVTVNLKWDWTNGTLIVFNTDAAGDYMSTDTNHPGIYITTYDALTGGGYTDSMIYSFRANGSEITFHDKTDDKAGLPKSATTTSFTLDDDGSNTMYIKWMVIA